MRIPFIDLNLYQQAFDISINKKNEGFTFEQSNSVIRTRSRSSTVIEPFIDKTIMVHAGKRSHQVVITAEMVGFKLGCFAFTKKMGSSIHNSERNRKKIAKMRRKITQKKIRKTLQTKKKPKKTKRKK